MDRVEIGLLEITKRDDAEHSVSGWASVVEENGRPVVDAQGDVIAVEELVKAAHAFVTNARVGKAMHDGRQVGEVVDSIVFTPEIQKSLGVDLGKVGWFITMKIYDSKVWDRVASGELRSFSVGGKGTREKWNGNAA